MPSVSAVGRYLALFDDPDEATKRVEGETFIPTPSQALEGLWKVNADCCAYLQGRSGESTATLDMDATLIETLKRQAQFCYKKFRAYQPLNVWWAEQQVVVHSEFRDGNVPAGYEQLRILRHALESLPDGVENVSLRCDTAGYEWDLPTQQTQSLIARMKSSIVSSTNCLSAPGTMSSSGGSRPSTRARAF